jgi:hypothetical protein
MRISPVSFRELGEALPFFESFTSSPDRIMSDIFWQSGSGAGPVPMIEFCLL